jgi:hypothetical protein
MLVGTYPQWELPEVPVDWPYLSYHIVRHLEGLGLSNLQKLRISSIRSHF